MKLHKHRVHNNQILKVIIIIALITFPIFGFILGMQYQANNWKLYTDNNLRLTFKYPNDLFPYKIENGVVAFFENKNDLTKCEAKNFDYCYKSKFSFNGFKKYRLENYRNYLDEKKKNGQKIELKPFIDKQNREWKTNFQLGQVYNFEGVYQFKNTYYILFFQGHTPESRNSFNQILSTVQFLD